jgi:DNA-binding transcriptional MerR regulator
VRFYIQKGLLEKPNGEKKGAWYSQDHLARLARIRQLSASGLSLDAVARQLDDRCRCVAAMRTAADARGGLTVQKPHHRGAGARGGC